MKIIHLVLSLVVITITITILYHYLPHTDPVPPQAQAQTPSLDCTDQDTTNWCQVNRNPEHTGYYSATLGTNISISWRYPFQPDKVFPQVQPIVYQNKVFVTTLGANGQAPSVYALDAINPAPNTNPPQGRVVWRYSADGPILGSVAAGNNLIYTATLNGSVIALNSLTNNPTGQEVWKRNLSWRLGFTTSPVLAEGKVFIGGQDGTLYALNAATGQTVWTYVAGAPLLQTVAYHNGRVFIASNDMIVHAINAANGTLVWKSPKLDAMAFKDYWPVVHQGKVWVRPMTASTNFFAFDEATGTPFTIAHQYDGQTMNGATAPPCIDKDNNFIVPATRTDNEWNSGWGRMSPTTGLLFDRFYDPAFPNAGYGNPDENMAVTCSQNLIFTIHYEEANANYTGFFNLDTRTWKQIGAGARNLQMSSNTQGGGTNPLSIAGNRLYHVSFYELIVRTIN